MQGEGADLLPTSLVGFRGNLFLLEARRTPMRSPQPSPAVRASVTCREWEDSIIILLETCGKVVYGERYSRVYGDRNATMSGRDPVLVSAPGKAILHGEHAVVYGKPALASSLDLRCFLLLLPTHAGTVVLELPDLQLERTWKVSELTDALSTQGIRLELLRQLAGISPNQETPSTQSLAMLAFLYLLTHIYEERLREVSGLHVTVVANLPASAGLGSSAAYSVCIAAALLCNMGAINRAGFSCMDTVESGQQNTDTSGPVVSGSCAEDKEASDSKLSSVNCFPELLVKKAQECGYLETERLSCSVSWTQHELEQVNKWGFEAEKIIHGTPSGIDNSISTFGGAICFQSGRITSLPNMPRVQILLIYTKVPRSTKKLVAGVRERYEKFPDILGPVLESITAIVQRAQTYLKELTSLPEDLRPQEEGRIYSLLQELFTLNQHLLDALGVGHPALERVCSIARQFGLAAKLTGAGGGGCAIALIPPGFSGEQLSEVRRAFTEVGFICWETVIGSNGVLQHTFTD